MKRTFLVLILAPLWGAACASVAEDESPPSLEACASEKDDAKRLACYDRAARAEPEKSAPAAPAEPAKAAPAAPVAPASAETKAPATKDDPESRFGYRGDIAREEHDRRKAEQEQIKEITATITDLKTLPYGEWVITLDNGQVWVQKFPTKQFRVEVGDRVTIKAGVLKSYLLVTESGRSTRVSRMR
ncbi:MAG TPA: hypothetical protein VF193_17630 [Steroidobacter sp.]|jgi:hypothetical protein